VLVRDRQSCERVGARTVALAEKFDLPYFRWYGRYLMGWAKAQRLTLSEGLAGHSIRRLTQTMIQASAPASAVGSSACAYMKKAAARCCDLNMLGPKCI
jgi:predicted ATPase